MVEFVVVLAAVVSEEVAGRMFGEFGVVPGVDAVEHLDVGCAQLSVFFGFALVVAVERDDLLNEFLHSPCLPVLLHFLLIRKQQYFVF